MTGCAAIASSPANTDHVSGAGPPGRATSARSAAARSAASPINVRGIRPITRSHQISGIRAAGRNASYAGDAEMESTARSRRATSRSRRGPGRGPKVGYAMCLVPSTCQHPWMSSCLESCLAK
jgi:hypothetical protein